MIMPKDRLCKGEIPKNITFGHITLDDVKKNTTKRIKENIETAVDKWLCLATEDIFNLPEDEARDLACDLQLHRQLVEELQYALKAVNPYFNENR